MEWIKLIGYVLVGLVGMEIISYCMHRWLFHGIFWNIHKTHHKPGDNVFEWNDIFSLFFSLISIWLIVEGTTNQFNSLLFGLGLGIAIYGMLYFIIHDLFAHKRFAPFKSDNPIMKLIRRAHQRHHQDVGKEGSEPYGLFLFPYDEYPGREHKFNRR